jgi:thymidylate kinase
MTREKFIERVKLIYGDKYDYSKVVYRGMKNDIILIDKNTGEEMVVSPKKLLYYKYKRVTDEEKADIFIKKSKEKYGDRYDYSKVVYRGCDKEVIVIDNSTGEEKRVKPKHFLYIDKRIRIDKRYIRRTNKEKADIFIKKSREKFGDRFDYSKVKYIDCKTPVTLICKECGEFTIDMYKHLRSKNGYCDSRKEYNRIDKGKLSTEYIIKKCQYFYGDKYDYSKVEYKGGSSKKEHVEIICPEHGSFFKCIDNINKRDCGCPRCAIKNRKRIDITLFRDKFIEKSKKKFGNRFDYSEVKYVNAQTPVVLICKEHGIKFSTTPSNHLNSRFGGCKGCYDRYVESTKKLDKPKKPKLTEEERKERRKKRL